MGTGERSWDGVVAAMMRRGCWSEADPVSVQAHIGANAQPKSGGSYSKPAGLALLHAGHLF